MELCKKAILVTGTSSGNGRAIALHLDHLGYEVFATVRNQKDSQELNSISSKRLKTLILDINKPDEINNAYDFIKNNLSSDEHLYAIINNAGIITLSTLELLTLKDIENNFHTNLIGHILVTQKFLPLLRKSKGKIINISSVAGRVSFPLMGIYSASKFGLNAISDAWRIELAKWDIKVITIESGAVKTPGWIKAEKRYEEIKKESDNEVNHLYKTEFKIIDTLLKHQSIMQTSSEKLAKQVARALDSKFPRATYRVGFGARWLNFISKFLPLNWLTVLLVKVFRKKT